MTFCQSCGKEVNENVKFCVACLTKRAVNTAETIGSTGRSKSASVALAVFLAYWTWLYTYKRDAWKFWVGLGYIFIIILSIETFGFSAFFTWLIILVLWIWAIVDTAVKKDEWYQNY